jgi:hypothetical protein
MSYAAHIHHYYPGAKDIKCVECGSDVDVVGVGCDAGSHLCLLAKRGHHYEEKKRSADLHDEQDDVVAQVVRLRARTILGNCGFFISFKGDINVGILFQTYFIAVLVRQRIFDAQFFVQRIGTFNPYLCLFRFVCMSRRDDFLNLGGQRHLGLFCHKEKGFWVRGQS